MKILDKNVAYQSGKDGYAGYRIPSLIKTIDGTILAFCEGRREGFGDTGYIDLIVKRSTDNGETWSNHTIVTSDGKNTFGNANSVMDVSTGKIHMICNFNSCEIHESQILRGEGQRKAYYQYSQDNGLTWSEPCDITSQVKKDNWGWLAFGPCHGIQLRSGRIVFVANHSNIPESVYYSYAIYSDDGCETFRIGEDVANNTNECSVAELDDGRVYINMRSYEGDARRRRAYSNDGGATWSSYEKDDVLIDPVCQGSVLSIKDKGILLSCNAASEQRDNLTIRLSRDNGLTWEESLVLNEGPSAYSDMVQIDDNTIGCLYEYGENHPYDYIGFATIKID